MRNPLIYATLFLLFAACEDQSLTDDNLNGSENFNRSIRFDVIHVYDISPLMDSVVENATILIYSEHYDFLNEAYSDATRQTDSLGQCEINGLDKDFYYIRAKHPSFADQIDSVSTPAHTTSYVEMIFY